METWGFQIFPPFKVDHQLIGYTVIHRSPAAINPVRQPDLTVVVPISNTAEYLKTCLDSLTAQRDVILELILVDFYSTDGSRDIALDFAHKFPDMQIVVADQIKGGLGGVRNFGIRTATAEFITFLDSDDLVVPDLYQEMVAFARTHDCDLALFKSIQFDQSTKISYLSHATWSWKDVLGDRPFLVANAREEPRIMETELHAANRVVRVDFMRKYEIFCSEGTHYEDLVPHLRSMLNAYRVGLVNRVGCFKREARVGQMTSERGRRSFEALDAADVALKEIEAFDFSENIGVAVIYIYLRSVYAGGGIRTHQGDRVEYYKRALAQYARFPRFWSNDAEKLHASSLLYRATISAFANKDMKLLLSLTAGNPSGLRLLFHFLCRGEWKYAWRKRGEIFDRMRAP